MPAPLTHPLRTSTDRGCSWTVTATGRPPTVAGWESGRDPSGETREKYAYFLKGADAKISTRDTTASEPAPLPPSRRPPTRTMKSRWTGQPSHRAGAGSVSGRGRL
ncbi:hypothetical protein [Streptomyces mirabilis]|uniref:hypothetical protein n=1 Tax=Streptomyces mirabilis TaxID=68239 RepID=UPI00381223AE